MSLINDALKRARQLKSSPERRGEQDPNLQPADHSTGPSPARSRALVLGAALLAAVAAGWFLWQWWQGQKPAPKPPVIAATRTNQTGGAEKAIAAESKADTADNKVEAAPIAAAPVTASVEPVQPVAPESTAAKLEEKSASAPEPVKPDALAAQPSSDSPGTPTTRPAGPVSVSVTTNSQAPPSAATAETRSEELPAAARPVVFPPLKLQGIYFRINKPSVMINNRTLYLGDQVDGARVVAIQRYSVKLELGGQTNELSIR